MNRAQYRGILDENLLQSAHDSRVLRGRKTDLYLVSLGIQSSKARGGVVYGQYPTAKGCSDARRNAERLDTAFSLGGGRVA
jgi:hypothetical protein